MIPKDSPDEADKTNPASVTTVLDGIQIQVIGASELSADDLMQLLESLQ